MAARPASHRRLYLGRETATEQAYYFDQFEAYDLDDSTDISVALIGDIGVGKSGVNKCHFVMRMLLIPNRYVVVLDKKLQGTEGEYAPLARRLGTEPVRFLVGGGGSRINLLDPAIGLYVDQPHAETGADSGDREQRPTGQMTLVRAVLREAMDRALSEQEGKAVRVALVAAHARARRQARVAIVADLVWSLFNPVDHYATDPAAAYDAETVWQFDHCERQPSPQVTAAELREWGSVPALALERLLEDDLVGLVDGETSPEVRADHPSGLTVFDISKLPSTGPALPIVMLLIQTWLSNVVATRAARLQQTICIVEEAWHVAVRGDIGAIFKENIKVSRGSGMSTVSGFHRPSDLPRDTPARALIQDVGTLMLFQQVEPRDVDETMRLAQLDPSMRAHLTQLAQGQCIVVRKGVDPVTVRVERSTLEIALTDTDKQITGRA